MRYSSHAQDDGFSIEAQEKAIKKFAEENNLDLQYIYCDKAKTGTNANRPEFQQMMSDAKKKAFEVCIVHKTDRFARSRLDSVVHKAILKDNGVELLSVTEKFRDDPEGKMLEGMAELFAEYYSENLAREVRKGMDVVASQGLHTGGTPPLGYNVKDKKLVINEAEAEIVRLIFDFYSRGYSYNDIAKELNLRGYKNKKGDNFSVSSFHSILNQRKYIGEYVYNRRASKKSNGSTNSHRNKPEEEITRIPNGVPRIVDDIVFNNVQRRLDENRNRRGTYRTKHPSLLSGKVKCGKCGFHYQSNTRAAGGRANNMYSSFRCGRKQNKKIGCGNSEVEKNRLETFVLELMEKHLFTDNGIKTILKLINEYNKTLSSTKSTDLELYERQLKEIDKKIKNASNAILKGLNLELMIEEMNQLDLAKKDILKRIEESKVNAMPDIVEEDVRKALLKFKEFMKENNFIECKNFIKQYVDSIIIKEDTVEVTFKVASAIFNALFPEDNSGMLLIKNEIPRTELKKLPKQRRKISSVGMFGKSYLKGYEIVRT